MTNPIKQYFAPAVACIQEPVVKQRRFTFLLHDHLHLWNWSEFENGCFQVAARSPFGTGPEATVLGSVPSPSMKHAEPNGTKHFLEDELLCDGLTPWLIILWPMFHCGKPACCQLPYDESPCKKWTLSETGGQLLLLASLSHHALSGHLLNLKILLSSCIYNRQISCAMSHKLEL